MKLRTRVATVVSAVLLLAGLGAGVQANAATRASKQTDPVTHGCIYIIPLQLAICIPNK